MSCGIESGKHVVACLEERLKEATSSIMNVSNAQKVIAYYKEEKPVLLASRTQVTVGDAWDIEWRSTSDPPLLEGCRTLCGKHASLGTRNSVCSEPSLTKSCEFPFWRGNGDDIFVQEKLHAGCTGDSHSPDMDDLGRVAYNNFRSLIFSCKEKGGGYQNHSFVLSPVIPHEGDELGKRIEQTLLLIRFLRLAGLQQIRVCVLKGSRVLWREKYRGDDVISRQAEIIKSNVLRRLTERKEDKDLVSRVKFIPDLESPVGADMDIDFEIERAIRQADLIVAFDGATGNILGRTFAYLCETTELYAIPWFIHNRPWPLGEGAFVGHSWADDSTMPLQRAIMWKILEGYLHAA